MKKIKQILNLESYLEKRALRLSEGILRNHKLIPITETREQDVFIAGFPKSGNTWMQNLIVGMLLDSTSKYLTLKLVSEIIPDVHVKKYYMRFFKTSILKTHGLPEAHHKRVIHLVRDGRDVMVSYHKMGLNKDRNFPYSLKDMVMDGKGVYPTKWHVHTNKWIENPYNSKILTIRFEDLHLQPMIELVKIREFLGLEVSENRLQEIFENNSINKLRKRVDEFGMDNDHTWRNKPITTFFRKGEIGGYRDEMSKDLCNYFNTEAGDELRHFNYL